MWIPRLSHLRPWLNIFKWETLLAIHLQCTLPPAPYPILMGVHGWIGCFQSTMWESKGLHLGDMMSYGLSTPIHGVQLWKEPRGWTLHWKPKWCVWSLWIWTSYTYKMFMEKNGCIFTNCMLKMDFYIYTELFKLMW